MREQAQASSDTDGSAAVQHPSAGRVFVADPVFCAYNASVDLSAEHKRRHT